jgi:DNA replication protein DnaC
MERLPESVTQDILRAAAAAASHLNGPPAPGAPLHMALEPRRALCPQHGEYFAQGTRFLTGRGKEIWSPCPDCVQQRKAEEQEAADLERLRRQQERLAALLGRAAVPARFVGRSFENYRATAPEQVRALTKLRDYAEHFAEHASTGESLMLLGKRGTGKSHLAIAVLQAILPRYCGMYTTAAEIISMVRDTWRKGSERSETQVLNMLGGVPLLVIDEVGVQYGTDSEQHILFQVLDRRYRERKPVILMANLDLKKLQALLGDRIYDRLRETAVAVPFEWESHRAQARQEAA